MAKISIPNSEKIFNNIEDLINEQPTENFNKRKKGLKLKTFLIAFTLKLCMMTNVTLEGLANQCVGLQYGLSIQKQALSNRLEQGSKELRILLAGTTKALLKNKAGVLMTATILGQFDNVYIIDSTTLSLPNKLKKYHKGLGGSNAESALKIQAAYEVKSKDFKKIEIVDNATESDNPYMLEFVCELKPNDLVVADLGYYSAGNFLAIAGKGAYFISRIKSNVNLYRTETTKLDLYKLLKGKTEIDEMIVIKGINGKSMSVRLVGLRLDEKSYASCIRKARKEAKSKGKTLSKEELELLKWVIYITNAERDILDIRAICEIYRIRWQIELIFKSWKSHFKLDKMNDVGKHYLDCLIYGKLVVITMMTSLYSLLFHQVYRVAGRQLSFLRFMKNVCEELDTIIKYFYGDDAKSQLIQTIDRVINSSLVEKRRRKTTEQSIASIDLPQEVLEMLL